MPESKQDLILSLKAQQGDILGVLRTTSEAIKKLEERVDKFSKEAANGTKKVEHAFTKMRTKIEGASGRIGRSFSGMLGTVSLALGAGGIVGIFSKSIKAAAGFETKLREVSTLLSGNAVRSMKKYEAAIRDMALRTSGNVEQLTSALYQTISAGVSGIKSVSSTMSFIETAYKASVAGVSGAFAAVDILSTSLNAYGKSTKDAMEFSDRLFTAVKMGKTTFNELASQVGMVASVAAGAKVSFGDINASLVAMTKGGLSTDIATTALRATIVSLLKPTKTLAAALKKNGYESGAAALEAKGLVGIMQLLNKETGGSTEALQKMFPNVRALTGITVMAGTGINDLVTAQRAMENSAGATEEAYGKMADTFEHKTARFWNVVNEVFLSLGKELMPFLIEKMEQISRWVTANKDKIVGWLKEAAKSIVAFGEWIVKWGPTIVMTMASIWAIGKISQFVTWVGKASIAVKGFAGWLSKTSAVGGPLALFGLGIGAAIAAAEALAGALSRARDEGRKAAKALKDAYTGIALEKVMPASFDDMKKDLELFRKDSNRIMKATTEDWQSDANVYWGLLNESYVNVVTRIKNTMKQVKEGKFDAAAKRAFQQRWAAITGEAAEKAPIPLRFKESSRRSLLDDLQATLQAVEERFQQVNDKQFELDKQLATKVELDRVKKKMETFKLTEKYLEALAVFEKSDIKELNKYQLKLLDNLVKAQDKGLVELDEKQKKQLDKFYKARLRMIRSLMEEEKKLREEAQKFIDNLRFKALTKEQQIKEKFEKDFAYIVEAERKKRITPEQFIKAEYQLRENKQKALAEESKRLAEEEEKRIREILDKRSSIVNMWSQQVQKAYDVETEVLRLVAEGSDKEAAQQASIALLRRKAEEDIQRIRLMGYEAGISTAKAEEAIRKKVGRQIEEVEGGFISKFTSGIRDSMVNAGEEVGIGFLRSLGSRAEGILSSVIDHVWKPIDQMINIAMTPINKVAELLSSALTGEGIGELQRILNQFVDFIKNLAYKLPETIQWIANVAIPMIVESVKQYAPDIINSLVELLPVVIDAIVNLLPIIFEEITRVFPRLINLLTDATFQIVAIVIEKIPDIVDAVIRGIPNIVTAFIKNIPNIAIAVGKAIAEAVKGFLFGRYSSETSWTRGEEGILPDEIPILGKLHEGGVIKMGLSNFSNSIGLFMNAVKAHSGLAVKPTLQPGDIPIIAKIGEAVMTPEWVRNAGGENVVNWMNKTGRMPESRTVINNNLSVQHMMSKDTREVIDSMMTENYRQGVGGMSRIIRKRTLPGFESRIK